MDIAIVGAGGVCGRQLLFMMIGEKIMPKSARLQLVTYRGGTSENELWGLRSDVADAFDEVAPDMEIVFDPEDIDADLVVMMAGATISTDPDAPVDRAALAQRNEQIFRDYAQALADHERKPLVVVQSNPVELGVRVFSEHLPRHRVLGAAGFSDTLRFSREIGVDLGVPRSAVRAGVLGQHGDFLVPCWSQVQVRGVSDERLAQYIADVRRGRDLADLPEEIRSAKAQMLALVRSGDVKGAYAYVESLPADVRFAVKPFFTHFTAGRTTEAATAHAVAWLVSVIMHSFPMAVSAQVQLEGEWQDLRGVTAAPVMLGPSGWSAVLRPRINADEIALLQRAVQQAG